MSTLASAVAAVVAAGLLFVAGCSDGVSAPSKSDPAAYTKFVVDQAIARYEAEGLDAALAHFNNPASVDDQWYVFVINENDIVVGHYIADRRGLNVKGWVGTDINGYNFGPEMLAATEAGRWVPYVYVNPAAGTLGDEGAFELKNAWLSATTGCYSAQAGTSTPRNSCPSSSPSRPSTSAKAG